MSAYHAAWNTFFAPYRTNPAGTPFSAQHYDRTVLETP